MTSTALTKEYDFRELKNLKGFNSKYPWPRKELINQKGEGEDGVGELQFYVDPDRFPEHSPFTLSDEGLQIRATLTPPELEEYAHGIVKQHMETYDDDLTESEREHAIAQPLVSGALTTAGQFEQRYGYFEARMKLPSARGAWPAFWLLIGPNWPKPEIDIMEAVKDVIDGVYHGSMHTNQSGVMVSSTGNEIVTGADLCNEYHNYGVRWERDFVVWYFDGVEVIRRRTPADMQGEHGFLLLNLAVGGWGGEPVLEDYAADSEVATLCIEWIRVYESMAESLPEDTVFILDNGEPVTLSQINHVTEYMIQSSRQAVKLGQAGGQT